MKLTRRQLAGLAAGTPVISAQTPAVKDTPEELLKSERESVRRAADSLNKVELPMATEPAFTFKAQ